MLFRLDEAHRSKCALYDAKPPILVSEQLSHNANMIHSYIVKQRAVCFTDWVQFSYGRTYTQL